MAYDSSPSTHFLGGKKIIVAGAGIAGLSFVIALRRLLQSTANPPKVAITIYDRDTKETSIGREGYSLSIRSDAASGGMQALQKLGLFDSMLKNSYTGTEDPGCFIMWDQNWTELVQIKGKTPATLPVASMRIARNLLRQGLVDALSPEDVLHWKTPCSKAEQLENGKVRVWLPGDVSEECDILIAADGANSKIRASIRPEDTLSFAGATLIAATSRFPDGLPKPLDRNWGTVLGGMGTGLFASPINKQSAHWSVSYIDSKPRMALNPHLSHEQVDGLVEEALDRGKAFGEPFKTLVRASDPSTFMVLNAMDKQPFSHTTENNIPPPIIFIGDANHAVSPFAGNGANMALMDGWELAEELLKSQSLEAAVKAYDASSMPRSKAAVDMSHWSISLSHAEGLKLWLYKMFFVVMKFLGKM